MIDGNSKKHKLETMKKRYDNNKNAKIGSEIICPFCGKKFIKTTYQKIFCNDKTKNKNHCKNFFWNRIDPEKRCRKTPFFYTNILNKNYNNVFNKVDEDILTEFDNQYN